MAKGKEGRVHRKGYHIDGSRSNSCNEFGACDRSRGEGEWARCFLLLLLSCSTSSGNGVASHGGRLIICEVR